MKKISRIILVSSLALSFGFSITSCNSQKGTTETSKNTTDLTKRHFKVKDFTNLEQGNIIDLEDYITVVPGIYETASQKSDLSWDYEILTDGSAAPVETYTLESSGISLYKTKKLVLSKEGVANIKLMSLDGTVEQFIDFKINSNSSLTQYQEKLSKLSYKNYTVNSNFEVTAVGEVKESDATPIFYKTEFYYYTPSTQSGFVYNQNDKFGYSYFLND